MLWKMLFGGLVVFSLFGIIMFSIFIHETFHVLHANHATGSVAGKSICFDMNQKTHSDDSLQQGYFAAHTVLDVDKWDNVESFNTWRELSEKYAGFIQSFLQVILSATLGGLLTLYAVKR